jgi:cystathionine beta-lyase/cystathionine gamma-synthase
LGTNDDSDPCRKACQLLAQRGVAHLPDCGVSVDGQTAEGAEFAGSVEPSHYYTRWGNPNTEEVEAVIAALEKTERALLTSSGMAAMATVFEAFLKPGDHVVAPAAIYMGTE